MVDSTTRRQVLRLGDLAVLSFAFYVTGIIAPWVHRMMMPGGRLYGMWPEALPPASMTAAFAPLSSFIWVYVAMVPAMLVCLELFGYRTADKQSGWRIAVSCITSPMVGLALLTVGFFVLRIPGYSRVFLFLFTFLSAAMLSFCRFVPWLAHRYRERQGVYIEELALVGSAAALDSVGAQLSRPEMRNRYRLVGYFAVEPDQRAPKDCDRLPCLGTASDVGDVLIHTPIQDVLICLPPGDAPWLDGVLQSCDYFRVVTYVVPILLLDTQLADLEFGGRETPFGLPAIKFSPPEDESDPAFVKRLIDIFVSAALLVFLAPLFLVIAIAIKLTTPRLSVFYPWRVVGYKGRHFTGYKFTTMVKDADDKKAELMSRNEMSGPVFKIADDPRVTPLGRFLRKFSLNELPQLWSVLKGDMSLVGPRPAGPHELKRYELWHKRKLSVLPGITCFWQVRGRNRISSFDDWVRMDLEYIENWSLWLDWKILIRTAWVVIRGTGS